MFVQIQTSLGSIRIKLENELTPKTVQNFLHYLKTDFYDNTIFHRVIPGFMIQGGGMDVNMHEKSTAAEIINEADLGLSNKRGTIAMARTSAPHSATSQFFINVADNAFLNHRSKSGDGWGYCAFGTVVEGMDVVDAIVVTPTARRAGHEDVPISAITIQKVTLEVCAEVE